MTWNPWSSKVLRTRHSLWKRGKWGALIRYIRHTLSSVISRKIWIIPHGIHLRSCKLSLWHLHSLRVRKCLLQLHICFFVAILLLFLCIYTVHILALVLSISICLNIRVIGSQPLIICLIILLLIIFLILIFTFSKPSLLILILKIIFTTTLRDIVIIL